MAGAVSLGIVRFRLLVGLGVALASARQARADGAFPNSLGVFVPADQPNRIILQANFGLVVTDDADADAGPNWRITCSSALGTPPVTFYQMSPSPADVIYGVTQCGIAISSDLFCDQTNALTCTQNCASMTNWTVYDLFADQSSQSHVVVTAQSQEDCGPWTMQVFDSQDQGKTFSAPLFTAPSNAFIRGIEVSLSDPSVLYLTTDAPSDNSAPPVPSIFRSTNSGGSFQQFNLQPAIGNYRVSIARVDPDDSSRVYLRVLDLNSDTSCGGLPCGDQLVMGVFPADGGSPSFTKLPFVGETGLGAITSSVSNCCSGQTLPAGSAIGMAMFYRRSNGDLIVSDSFGQVYIAPNGATLPPDQVSFQRWNWSASAPPTLTGAPHLGAMAERAGALYAVGCQCQDGWALGVSTNWASVSNDQVAWTPLMNLNAVRGTATCQHVVDVCNICFSGPPDAGSQSGPDASMPMADGGSQTSSGCGCGSAEAAPWMLAAAFGIAVQGLRRRRRN
jgi:MYXO-CTERM domain-containing protein